MSKCTTPNSAEKRKNRLRGTRNKLLGKMIAKYLLSQEQLTQTKANDNPSAPEQQTDSKTA